MLKNAFDYKGKREYQDGMIQFHDKIWVYGYNLKDPEIQFLTEKFKVNPKFLKQINEYTRPRVLSKSPYTFVIHDFLVDKKAIQNNILFVAGENFILTLMPNKINEYEKVFKSVLDLDYFEVIRNIFMKSLQTNFDTLDSLEIDIEKLQKKDPTVKQLKAMRAQLNLIEGTFRETINFLETGFTFRFDEYQKETLSEMKATFQHQIETVKKLQQSITQLALPFAKKPKKASPRKIGALLINIGLLLLVAAILLGILVYPELILLILGIALPEDIVLRAMIAMVAMLAVSFPFYFFLLEWKD